MAYENDFFIELVDFANDEHKLYFFSEIRPNFCRLSPMSIQDRPVAWEGLGGASVPPVFGRSVNPLSTRGGAHYPHPVLQAPRIFRPCDGPAIDIAFCHLTYFLVVLHCHCHVFPSLDHP